MKLVNWIIQRDCSTTFIWISFENKRPKVILFYIITAFYLAALILLSDSRILSNRSRFFFSPFRKSLICFFVINHGTWLKILCRCSTECRCDSLQFFEVFAILRSMFSWFVVLKSFILRFCTFYSLVVLIKWSKSGNIISVGSKMMVTINSWNTNKLNE